MREKVVVYWMRRDLRLHDNHALYKALTSGYKVLPLFIFDSDILDFIENKADARVSFIYSNLNKLNESLKTFQSSVLIKIGKPRSIFDELVQEWDIVKVFVNNDFEPYAMQRDRTMQDFLKSKGIEFSQWKDHLIFEPGEILKADNQPYTVYTPFSKKWKSFFNSKLAHPYPSEKHLHHCIQRNHRFPALQETGFKPTMIGVPDPIIDQGQIKAYEAHRNIPSVNGTSLVGPHLRFGTISIRELVRLCLTLSETYLNELIWREFFIHILYFYPHSATENFNAKYNRLVWRNDENEFHRWCEGTTGFPLVDAGMRELNTTGYMHNRVRMVVAGFLTKHLLIDWRWGEAYFAARLLDFELASNVGNWQWAAGTGCDAAPYFRVFNPGEQLKKFDPQLIYTSKWVPEVNDLRYQSDIIVDHAFARNRAISAYKEALSPH